MTVGFCDACGYVGRGFEEITEEMIRESLTDEEEISAALDEEGLLMCPECGSTETGAESFD